MRKKHIYYLFFIFCLSLGLKLYAQVTNVHVKCSTNQPWPFSFDEKPDIKQLKYQNKNYYCKIVDSALFFLLLDETNPKHLKDWIKIGPVYFKSWPINQNMLRNASLQLAIDTSETEFKNRLYITWADQKNGIHNWDIFLVYSDDDGKHWTEPILVTYKPNHKNQFMPKLSINQTNGALYLVYFDQQNDVSFKSHDVCLAKSTNGGLKFDYLFLNKNAIKTKAKTQLNNQLNLNNQALKIRWSSTNKTDFYQCELIDTLNYYHAYNNISNKIEINKSFKFTEQMILEFKCAEPTNITFELTKPIDPSFKPMLIKTKKFKKGNNQLLMDMKALGINKGNYTLTLYFKGINKYIWITEE